MMTESADGARGPLAIARLVAARLTIAGAAATLAVPCSSAAPSRRVTPKREMAPTVRFGIVVLPETLAGFGALCREVEEK